MKEFSITIMSIDPKDKSEDNHQKYCMTVESTDYETAKRIAKQDFINEHGNLPIYWVK